MVTVCKRRLKGFDKNAYTTFGINKPSAAIAKRVTLIPFEQHIFLAELRNSRRMQCQIYSAHQGCLAFARAYALNGKMQCGERRGTGGIQRNARAAKIKKIGHSIGDIIHVGIGKSQFCALAFFRGKSIVGICRGAHKYTNITS